MVPPSPAPSDARPAPTAKRRMLLSVDVEAFEMRSREATLERLIWGRFPEGDFGLERIMSLAEAAGAPLTMFLDYPEFYAYGEGLLDVGREIVRRGHDLNLHLHLDCLPADYFTKRGVAKGGNLNTFDDDTARALVDDVVELHGRVASAPAALRGGGYRYNGSLLRALRSAGVPISSNYNRAAKLQPFDLGPRRQFTWDVGTLELPVASLTGFLNRRYATHLNFNIAPFIAVDEATALANSAAFLDQFYREHGDDAVAVFVMHSWSFLGMDSSGQFSFVNTDAPARLAALLSAWSKWAEFVTAQDVLRLSRNGSLVIDGPLAIPSVNLDVRGASEARDAGARALAGPHSSCPICGTSGAEFVDYNGPKRRCPTCGSTERQRVFVHVYETLRTDFDLANKDVLVVAPAVSERRYLKEQGIRWKSLDIRPEVRADITGDLCNLSDVPDASFDAVIASFVLTCVHDVDACLSELSRILRPGGKLLTCDPLRFGQATIEHQDVARITAWYGQEPYEKYRVGCFRHLGEVDLQRRFEAHGFSVRPMEWLDVPTNSRWVWYVSTKPGSTSTRASASEEGLEGLKQRVAQLEKELQRQRQLSASLEAQLEKAQNTLSFRLGYLLLHAPKSFAALRRLPAELWALHREAKIRRAKRSANSPDRSRPSASERREEEQRVADEAARVFLEKGMAAAVTYVEGAFASQRDCAETLGRLAKSLRSSAPHEAASLARRAHELDPTPNRAKSLALLEFARGAVSTPAALLDELPSDLVLTPGERDRVAEIRGLAAMRHRPPTIPVRSPRASYTPVARRALYLTASAQPFHLSGYTVRTHAVVRATRDAGFDVVTALRPGYPADRGFTPAEPHHELGGVTYHHVAGPPLRRTPLDRYVAEASSSLTAFARGARPQLIHAASNYVNALPALIAARRLGVPFVYEVRGMWELTAASRFPDWETSERFEIDRDLEGLVAREADLVFTLTEGLSKELVARGVSPEKIVLLPNAVDPDAFAPRPRDEALATQFGIGEGSFTLAYAGSLLGYEGLDDALRAVALLASRGVDVRFLIAGDGEAMEALRKLTADLGIERRVTFLGRLLPSEIPMIWSLADAAAFPRKPFKVCELVSPLKPLEPMTMGIPVVVSNVAALKEMVRDGQTGLVHRADDAVDLAEKLGELQRDATLRSRLGQAARAAVLQERTWESAGRRVVTHYERLLRRADVGGATDPALHGVRV